MLELYYTTMSSPIGKILLLASDHALLRLTWIENINQAASLLAQSWKQDFVLLGENHITGLASKQLSRYFEKKQTVFQLPLQPRGTPFQMAVWEKLEEIPLGNTRSYKDIAVAIGNPKAVRAVGQANGRNPIPIIIPCHRVVLSSGKLGGFSSGVEIKDWLLRHEGVIL